MMLHVKRHGASRQCGKVRWVLLRVGGAKQPCAPREGGAQGKKRILRVVVFTNGCFYEWLEASKRPRK